MSMTNDNIYVDCGDGVVYAEKTHPEYEEWLKKDAERIGQLEPLQLLKLAFNAGFNAGHDYGSKDGYDYGYSDGYSQGYQSADYGQDSNYDEEDDL